MRKFLLKNRQGNFRKPPTHFLENAEQGFAKMPPNPIALPLNSTITTAGIFRMKRSDRPGEDELINNYQSIFKFTKMKKITYLIVGASMMFFACSTDEPLYHESVDVPDPLSGGLSVAPGNGTNAHDHIGRAYREVMEQYLKTNGTDAREDFDLEVHSLLSGGNRLSGKRPVPATSTGHKTGVVPGGPWQALEALVAGSGLSLGAQLSLLSFIEAVLVIQYDGYPVLYDYIVGYESLVTGHPDFTEMDKQITLSFSSLVRYATYPGASTLSGATEVEDEDWDLSVGNAIDLMLLAFEGAGEETAGALTSSLRMALLTPRE